jgi:hypothetical protein
MTNDSERARERAAVRLFREMFSVGLVYVAAVLGSSLVIKGFDPPQWVAALLAIAPIAPALLALNVQLRYMRATDEFERRLQSEAVLIAAAVVAFTTLAYGQLEDLAGFPDISLMFVLPALWIVWSAASVVLHLRYK